MVRLLRRIAATEGWPIPRGADSDAAARRPDSGTGWLRALHAVEAELRRFMAPVAGGSELVEGLSERRLILGRDGLAQIRDRRRGQLGDHVLDGDRRVLVRRVELHRVVEPLFELVQFVGREVPVARLAREPQLHVPHLLQSHDLSQAGRVRLGGRRRLRRGRSRRLARTACDPDCGCEGQTPSTGAADHHEPPTLGFGLGTLDVRTLRTLDLWTLGPLDPWTVGPLDPWTFIVQPPSETSRRSRRQARRRPAACEDARAAAANRDPRPSGPLPWR